MAFANGRSDREAIHALHLVVEDDGIHTIVGEQPETARAIVGSEHRIAVHLKHLLSRTDKVEGTQAEQLSESDQSSENSLVNGLTDTGSRSRVGAGIGSVEAGAGASLGVHNG